MEGTTSTSGPHTYICNLCLKPQPERALMTHLPQCFRQESIKMNQVPLCTCNSCCAERTHPGDVLHEQPVASEHSLAPPRKRGPSAITSSTEGRAIVDPTYSKSSLDYNTENPLILDIDQLQASKCLVCNEKKSPSQVPLPFIYIGAYHEVMICVKAHLSNTEQVQFAKQIIDRYNEKVRLKDEPEYILGSLSPDAPRKETTAVADDAPLSMEQCGGFQDYNNPVECGEFCRGTLFIKHGGSEIFFCRASHCLGFIYNKYLMHKTAPINEHRTTKGRARPANKQRRKKKSTNGKAEVQPPPPSLPPQSNQTRQQPPPPPPRANEPAKATERPPPPHPLDRPVGGPPNHPGTATAL
eukprot:TRINITY_DN12953_c0_g1_i1.p1 TRINITY_DN12953_c0_g1~~TRINITY_DN12953_c0_g1_i1.p1  ORF type:complete len:355 (+),score=15.21 TRINITY_DN12953_c0_g1_i1:158-1222(+)